MRPSPRSQNFYRLRRCEPFHFFRTRPSPLTAADEGRAGHSPEEVALDPRRGKLASSVTGNHCLTIRPPLSMARLPAVDRITVGDRSVPESSWAPSTVFINSCRLGPCDSKHFDTVILAELKAANRTQATLLHACVLPRECRILSSDFRRLFP